MMKGKLSECVQRHTVSYVYILAKIYTACVVWCGIGCYELMKLRFRCLILPFV